MSTRARAFQEACRLHSRDQMPHACSRLSRFRAVRHHSSSRTVRPAIPRRPAGALVPPLPTPTRHASTSAGPSRRAITVTTDDGRYNWKDLSTGEKAARGTQQTFNFLLASLGLVGTITVAYLLYTELFSPSSSTVQFNAAVNRIKASSESRAILGPSSQIIAYGEPTNSKWARPRPIAHSTEVDKHGVTHFRMHFNVQGTESGVSGVVRVHMTKPKTGDRLEYEILSLSVKGHETVYVENRAASRGVKGQAAKIFGVQWR